MVLSTASTVNIGDPQHPIAEAPIPKNSNIKPFNHWFNKNMINLAERFVKEKNAEFEKWCREEFKKR